MKLFDKFCDWILMNRIYLVINIYLGLKNDTTQMIQYK